MAGRDDGLLNLLDLGLPDEFREADWRVLGFREPVRMKEGCARLRARVDIAQAMDLRFADMLRALAKSCDPDQAFAGLERWLEAGGAALGTGALDWTDEGFLTLLCALFAGTPALSEYFIRFPNRTRPVLQPVLERNVRGGLEWFRAARAALAAAPSHKLKLAALRRSRTEAILRIAALDLSGAARLEDTVRTLSDLADACVSAALEAVVEHLRPLHGAAAPRVSAGFVPEAPPPPPFVVMGMGKLGGRELNYSSDIDLVFLYAGEGWTQGHGRSLEHADYFRRVGEELIAALDQVTEDGRVYRVDMRLRPHGGAGTLVHSVRELLAYLHSEGRTWERQAWLKARPVAGDLALGDALLQDAAPWVFQRYLSLDSIGEMKELKRQMELAVARRGETDDEVKLGRGGIRDVEFTVQFLQLLHGGQHPRVRGSNTLRALDSLRQEGLLRQTEAESLTGAYIFLRNVEHRLQLHGDRQTHKLPAEPVARRRVARSLGYADLSAHGAGAAGRASAQPPAAEAHFEAERQAHVTRVRESFESLFANLFNEQSGPEGELSDLLLAPEADRGAIAALLPAFGFRGAPETAEEMERLGRERLVLTNPARTRKFFASLAPHLLKALAATGDPEGSLRRFSRIAHSLGGKAVFYQALHENPWLLKAVAELAAWSEYLTEILVANPGLFDELVDSLRTNLSKTQAEMEAELAQVASGGDVSDTLRAYRAGELLRIGVRDLLHSVPLEQTQAELADLAAAILRVQLAHSLKAFRAARGEPKTEDGRGIGFAVLAVGKFGGREMNYASDLDVLFFYGEEGAAPGGCPAVTYFAELAQTFTRAMATPTILGSLYQVDARLRPNGSKGPLASSLPAFERYWKEGALADWERLALTRARHVAGDAGVGERAEHLIRSAVYSPLTSQSLAREVASMRRRVEESAGSGDIKRGRGGSVDIEFLAQYLQLVHGPAYPPLRQANTRKALQTLLKFNKLSAADGKTLLEAYEFLGRMANGLRIVQGLSANTLPSSGEALRKLALRSGYADGPEGKAEAALEADYRRFSSAVREIFERVVA